MGLAFGRLARILQTSIANDNIIMFSNIQVLVVGAVITITWNTNLSSTSGLVYGETSSYGGAVINSNDGNTLSHTIIIDNTDGLTPGQLYHFRVASEYEGVWYYSSDNTFSTEGLQLPVISNVVATPSASSMIFTWSTNIGSDSYVLWGDTPLFGHVKSSGDSGVTTHSVTVGAGDGVVTGDTCYYKVASSSDGSNYSYSPDSSTFLPLIFTSINADVVTTTITFSWVTGEGSDSAVEWGATTGYGNVKTSADSGVTSHSVILDYDDGVRGSNTYHYRVRSSTDGGLTYSYSSDQTVVVPYVAAAGISLEDSSGIVLTEDNFTILLESGISPVKISDMSTGSSLTGTETLPGVQSTSDVAISINQIKTYIRS